jgi:hypothetical protein
VLNRKFVNRAKNKENIEEQEISSLKILAPQIKNVKKQRQNKVAELCELSLKDERLRARNGVWWF